LTPKLTDYADNFIVMEKIEGVILSEYYKHGEIYNLLTWAKNNLWINKNTKGEYKKNCYNFYINKTNSRINDLQDQLNELQSKYSTSEKTRQKLQNQVNKIVVYRDIFLKESIVPDAICCKLDRIIEWL
jgi:hypothetical protein